MPDISMCEGKGCDVKNTCYRFTAKPSKFMQSYVMPDVPPIENEGCEYYWNNNYNSALSKPYFGT